MNASTKSTTKQLTVRGVDDPLHYKLREQAHARGISVNRYVVELLREGVGLTAQSSKVYDDLDALWGTWDSAAANEFDTFLESTSHVDEEMWQ